MTACLFNGHAPFCRQRAQSFVDGGEHFGRLLGGLIKPMAQRLLLFRLESQDGILDFSEFGHAMTHSLEYLADNPKTVCQSRGLWLVVHFLEYRARKSAEHLRGGVVECQHDSVRSILCRAND